MNLPTGNLCNVTVINEGIISRSYLSSRGSDADRDSGYKMREPRISKLIDYTGSSKVTVTIIAVKNKSVDREL